MLSGYIVFPYQISNTDLQLLKTNKKTPTQALSSLCLEFNIFLRSTEQKHAICQSSLGNNNIYRKLFNIY